MVKFDSMMDENVQGALCTRSSPRDGVLRVTRPVSLGPKNQQRCLAMSINQG